MDTFYFEFASVLTENNNSRIGVPERRQTARTSSSTLSFLFVRLLLPCLSVVDDILSQKQRISRSPVSHGEQSIFSLALL